MEPAVDIKLLDVQASSKTKDVGDCSVGVGTLRLDIRKMKEMVRWLMISHSSRKCSYEGEPSSRRTIAPQCHTQAYVGDIMLRRTFSWMGP
ncbi:hypothetical protein TNCV_1976211 [Trichonephila clavipes]|nr:hypothetical protein TNCV_1976211 [Trichonephila clavipes]